MRVLVTGGAGFVGSHLVEACLDRGDEVYVIDNLSTGDRRNLEHLRHLEGDRLFVTVGSVLDYSLMLELVGTCDVVFHLAAVVGVRTVLDDPLEAIRVNVRGTDVVLELCNKFKKRVLIASTSEVYGKQLKAPLYEEDPCVYGPSAKARWSYAATKLMDEFTALAYHRRNRLFVVVTRLFNTTGPRQSGRYGMVLPRFVDQALANKPITVYGDGTQTRTFTHVADVVPAMLALIDTPEANGEIVNVGGRQEVSVLELAELVRGMAGSRSEIRLVPYERVYPSDFEDMARRVPATDKLRRLVGFAPQTPLETIVADVIAYRRACIETPDPLVVAG